MKECDILGGQKYSDPSYIFSGGLDPQPPGSTPLISLIRDAVSRRQIYERTDFDICLWCDLDRCCDLDLWSFGHNSCLDQGKTVLRVSPCFTHMGV